MKLPISLVIITQGPQELSLLERCIKSANFVTEVIVVDISTGSAPLELSHLGDIRVYSSPLKQSGEQRQWGVTQATNDWVLCLESNEVISEELASEILEQFTFFKENILYRIPRVVFYLNRWIWHGGYFPDFQGRLFNRQFYYWNDDSFNPRVEGLANFKHLTGPLEYFIYKDMDDHLQSTQQAAFKAAQQTAKFYKFEMVTRPVGYFLKHYFILQGFRDGWPGLILAVQGAHTLFMQAVYQFEINSLESLK